MKNYMDQFRMTVVAGTDDYTSSKTLNAVTDLKMIKGKLYDTSSSANAFASLTAGDVVKMSGWDDTAMNGIFKIVEVESSGEWVTFDTPLNDVLEDDIPSAGITMEDTPISMTVTGVAEGESKVLYALNMTDPAVAGPSYFKVTADNTVSSFADLSQDTSSEEIVVFWADLSEG
jgi:hypothetical protein